MPGGAQLSECLDLANEMTSLRIKLNARCYSALTITLVRARRMPMVRQLCYSPRVPAARRVYPDVFDGIVSGGWHYLMSS